MDDHGHHSPGPGRPPCRVHQPRRHARGVVDPHPQRFPSRRVQRHLPGGRRVDRLPRHAPGAGPPAASLRGAASPPAPHRRAGEGPPGREGGPGLPGYDEYVSFTRLYGTGSIFATVLPESVVSRPASNPRATCSARGAVAAARAGHHVLGDAPADRPAPHGPHPGQRTAGDGGLRRRAGHLARRRAGPAGQGLRADGRADPPARGGSHRCQRAAGAPGRGPHARSCRMSTSSSWQTARQAGRAEVATNVLHNVGNVLNSVYTSARCWPRSAW